MTTMEESNLQNSETTSTGNSNRTPQRMESDVEEGEIRESECLSPLSDEEPESTCINPSEEFNQFETYREAPPECNDHFELSVSHSRRRRKRSNSPQIREGSRRFSRDSRGRRRRYRRSVSSEDRYGHRSRSGLSVRSRDSSKSVKLSPNESLSPSIRRTIYRHAKKKTSRTLSATSSKSHGGSSSKYSNRSHKKTAETLSTHSSHIENSWEEKEGNNIDTTKTDDSIIQIPDTPPPPKEIPLNVLVSTSVDVNNKKVEEDDDVEVISIIDKSTRPFELIVIDSTSSSETDDDECEERGQMDSWELSRPPIIPPPPLTSSIEDSSILISTISEDDISIIIPDKTTSPLSPGKTDSSSVIYDEEKLPATAEVVTSTVFEEEQEEDLEELELRMKALQGLLAKKLPAGSPCCEVTSTSITAFQDTTTIDQVNVQEDTDTYLQVFTTSSDDVEIAMSSTLSPISFVEPSPSKITDISEDNEKENELELYLLRAKLLSDLAKKNKNPITTAHEEKSSKLPNNKENSTKTATINSSNNNNNKSDKPSPHTSNYSKSSSSNSKMPCPHIRKSHSSSTSSRSRSSQKSNNNNNNNNSKKKSNMTPTKTASRSNRRSRNNSNRRKDSESSSSEYVLKVYDPLLPTAMFSKTFSTGMEHIKPTSYSYCPDVVMHSRKSTESLSELPKTKDPKNQMEVLSVSISKNGQNRTVISTAPTQIQSPKEPESSTSTSDRMHLDDDKSCIVEEEEIPPQTPLIIVVDSQLNQLPMPATTTKNVTIPIANLKNHGSPVPRNVSVNLDGSSTGMNVSNPPTKRQQKQKLIRHDQFSIVRTIYNPQAITPKYPPQNNSIGNPRVTHHLPPAPTPPRKNIKRIVIPLRIGDESTDEDESHSEAAIARASAKLPEVFHSNLDKFLKSAREASKNMSSFPPQTTDCEQPQRTSSGDTNVLQSVPSSDPNTQEKSLNVSTTTSSSITCGSSTPSSMIRPSTPITPPSEIIIQGESEDPPNNQEKSLPTKASIPSPSSSSSSVQESIKKLRHSITANSLSVGASNSASLNKTPEQSLAQQVTQTRQELHLRERLLRATLQRKEEQLKLSGKEKEFLKARKNATQFLGQAIEKINNHTDKKKQCAQLEKRVETIKNQLLLAERSLQSKIEETASMHSDTILTIKKAFQMRNKTANFGAKCKELGTLLIGDNYKIPTTGAAEMLAKVKEIFKLTKNGELKAGAVNFKTLECQILDAFATEKILSASNNTPTTIERSSLVNEDMEESIETNQHEPVESVSGVLRARVIQKRQDIIASHDGVVRKLLEKIDTPSLDKFSPHESIFPIISEE